MKFKIDPFRQDSSRSYDNVIHKPNVPEDSFRLSPEEYEEIANGISSNISTLIANSLKYNISQSTYLYHRAIKLIEERRFVNARAIVDNETVPEVKEALKKYFMIILLESNPEYEEIAYKKFPFRKSEIRSMDYDTFMESIDNYLVKQVLNGTTPEGMTIGELVSEVSELWMYQSKYFDTCISSSINFSDPNLNP